MADGFYTADGVDNRAITGLPFQPDVVIIKGTVNIEAVIRTSSMGLAPGESSDSSKGFASLAALQPNMIRSLNSDGFTIGTDDRVNRPQGAKTYT